MAESTAAVLNKKKSPLIRKQILINGIVQGVGFRPFIYKLAGRSNLSGMVSNSADGVIIEVQGQNEEIDNFSNAVKTAAPSAALITSINSILIPLKKEKDFSIMPSRNNSSVSTFISPDLAVCPDCLTELVDPGNRRFLYPFINCTNCGPRYTIIKQIPYDRPFTSMAQFELCPACRKEYTDPANRRFHAQPNACPACGPHCEILDSAGNHITSADPLKTVVEEIKNGKIAAIKGLGGFHLAVDATNEKAVKNLRFRKGHEAKPLAIMVKDIKFADQILNFTEAEKIELESIAHPIVVVDKKPVSPLAESIAPGLKSIGVMLPYTPLHHLLFYYGAPPLVLTSANISDEPICIKNSEAKKRLRGIADFFLVHDRKILTRTDDSVLRLQNGRRSFLRRSRGFVPRPVQLPFSIPSVLALGGVLKNTICVTRGDQAFLSQHLGDLDNAAACRFFDETIEYFLALHQIEPEVVIHDSHPDYYSTRAAQQFGLPTIKIQHHHAHIAATMAEYKLEEAVLGLALDGFGLGDDGAAWGGELLEVNGSAFSRIGHLLPLPHPGGDLASRQSWRMGAAVLHCLGKTETIISTYSRKPHVEKIVELLNKPHLSGYTTSCGRWFDAAASLLGICDIQNYEGQAPGLLESLVNLPETFSRGWIIDKNILDLLPLMEYLLDKDPISGANYFHGTLAAGLVDWTARAAQERGIKTIVCGGGCFFNKVLVELLSVQFKAKGFKVYFPRQLPPGDGGLSFGQAWAGGLAFVNHKDVS